MEELELVLSREQGVILYNLVSMLDYDMLNRQRMLMQSGLTADEYNRMWGIDEEDIGEIVRFSEKLYNALDPYFNTDPRRCIVVNLNKGN